MRLVFFFISLLSLAQSCAEMALRCCLSCLCRPKYMSCDGCIWAMAIAVTQRGLEQSSNFSKRAENRSQSNSDITLWSVPILVLLYFVQLKQCEAQLHRGKEEETIVERWVAETVRLSRQVSASFLSPYRKTIVLILILALFSLFGFLRIGHLNIEILSVIPQQRVRCHFHLFEFGT